MRKRQLYFLTQKMIFFCDFLRINQNAKALSKRNRKCEKQFKITKTLISNFYLISFRVYRYSSGIAIFLHWRIIEITLKVLFTFTCCCLYKFFFVRMCRLRCVKRQSNGRLLKSIKMANIELCKTLRSN